MNEDEIKAFLETTSGKPDCVMARIIRPKRDAGLIKDDVGIEGVIAQTRGDIDHGAGGHVMLDRDFKPTGEPPPDPLEPIACSARSGFGRTATTPRFRS